jgi:hypothetical protein
MKIDQFLNLKMNRSLVKIEKIQHERLLKFFLEFEKWQVTVKISQSLNVKRGRSLVKIDYFFNFKRDRSLMIMRSFSHTHTHIFFGILRWVDHPTRQLDWDFRLTQLKVTFWFWLKGIIRWDLKLTELKTKAKVLVKGGL